MRTFNNILITGGCGFIGLNLIDYIFKQTDFVGNIIVVDNLTYASNVKGLYAICQNYQQRYVLYENNIKDYQAMLDIIDRHNIDLIIHCAAESHVDRSIFGPSEFINTNIYGTFNLLECLRKINKNILFYYMGTDEVYGPMEYDQCADEHYPYHTGNPYSATKAASDCLVMAYGNTYDIPIFIGHCTNNYGPYQFPEKMIPLSILNALQKKPLGIFGDGHHIRDWLYVEDHCSAVWSIVSKGKIGNIYNIGTNNPWDNLSMIKFLCSLIADITQKDINTYLELLTFIPDRRGHDKKYHINPLKIQNELGWHPKFSFETGLRNTIHWYINHYSEGHITQ